MSQQKNLESTVHMIKFDQNDSLNTITIITKPSNMPFVGSTVNVSRGDSFEFGPYGLELISCLVSIGWVLE